MSAPWTLILLAASTTTPSPPAAPPPAPPPPACAAAEHRQFDFWIGEWIVTRPDTGAVSGHSTVVAGSAGCVLREHWRGASGYEGHSLNAWDASRARWIQVWVGADGVVLRLEGGLRDGAMVMEGELPQAGGPAQKQRITWSPGPDGGIRQHWQVSTDGETWTTQFIGDYRRAGDGNAGVGGR